MRSLVFAALALALTACDGKSPTDSGSQNATRATVSGPVRSTATGGYLTVDVPNTIVANEDGICDYPIYFTSTASSVRHLSHVALVVDTEFYTLTVSQLEGYFGPILPGQTTGGAFPDSDLPPTHIQAPYYGYWLVGWTDGATNYTAQLNFFCKQQKPPL